MFQLFEYLPQIDYITYSEEGLLSSPVAALILSHKQTLNTTFLFFYN